jgi:type IV pilus assembly protein PilB
MAVTPQKSPGVDAKLAAIRREGEERDAKRRAEAGKFPYADLRKVPISLEALKLISKESAEGANIAALELKLHDVAVAVLEPSDEKAKEIIKGLEAQHYKVKVFVVSRSSLEQAWRFYEFVPAPTKKITGKVIVEQAGSASRNLGNFLELQKALSGLDFSRVTTADLFELIIAGALAQKASDVHFEAEEKQARLRYRLDGYLHDVYSAIPLRNYANLISRVKLLSGLKINVRDEAQDGRYTITLPTKEVEVRVSVIPAEFGETIVMRLLDPDSLGVGLDVLGMRPDDLVMVEGELAKPNGLILNTGPTGSGKTTTLYAFLRHISKPEIKVITIEDPIEYRLSGIEQTQVDNEAGYTFANGLRAILRQDPDVVLVGEVRDAETADIAMQAALTGHLVFSTLHTNDAVGAVPRLIDLGIRPATVGPALSLVIAQRLVRRLCQKCKKAAPIAPQLSPKIAAFVAALPARIDRALYGTFAKDGTGNIFEPVGCDACSMFGYKGRIGIFEFLRRDEEFEEAILKSASEVTLRQIAKRQEMVPMQQDGILKVLAGETSFKEVEEVTGPIKW